MPGTMLSFISVISFDANKSPETVSILQTRSPGQDYKTWDPDHQPAQSCLLMGRQPQNHQVAPPLFYTDEETEEKGVMDPEWVGARAGALMTCQAAFLLRHTVPV